MGRGGSPAILPAQSALPQHPPRQPPCSPHKRLGSTRDHTSRATMSLARFDTATLPVTCESGRSSLMSAPSSESRSPCSYRPGGASKRWTGYAHVPLLPGPTLDDIPTPTPQASAP